MLLCVLLLQRQQLGPGSFHAAWATAHPPNTAQHSSGTTKATGCAVLLFPIRDAKLGSIHSGHPQLLDAGKLLARGPAAPFPRQRTQDCNLESSQFSTGATPP